MNRRRFLVAGAAAVATRPPLAQLGDGQTILIGGVEYVLSDIIAPSPTRLSGGGDPGADYTGATLQRLLAAGSPIPSKKPAHDRWGRLAGPIRWRTDDEKETTLQEALLEAGAARVFPKSKARDFILDCYAAEVRARETGRGNWRLAEWAVRDAARPRFYSGLQIWRGRAAAVEERKGRVFVNFGADYRNDLTATTTRGLMRGWKEKIDESLEGAEVELRGVAVRINGPSIELRHELQLRRISKD